MASQYRVVVANNIEEFHAQNSRFVHQCYQLEQGPFWGKTEAFNNTATTFSRRTIGCTILERGRAPNYLRSFTFHCSNGKFIRNGVSFRENDICVSCNGDAFVTFLRKGCSYYSLMVSDSFAKKLLSKSEWALYQGINAAERSVLVRKSPEFSCIVQRLDNVLDQLSAGYLVDSNNETIRAIQQHLLQDIVVMVGNAKPETLRINSNHRLLYRASRIVMDCRTRPISVDELAKRVGTSRRNLEHLFRSIVGLSPKQFMLNVRLNRIREDLVHKTTNNVMGIAKRYGIKHLGHFSSAYKSVFKELPSETRARASTLTG